MFDCKRLNKKKSDVSIFFRHGNTPQHFKILFNADGEYYLWPQKTFSSINKLIDYYRTTSIARDSRVNILLRDSNEVSRFSMITKLGLVLFFLLFILIFCL